MTNRPLTVAFLIGLLNCLAWAAVSPTPAVSPAAHADNTMAALINQFKSSNPDVRSVAFSSAVARPVLERNGAYEKALIGLLDTEIAYATATPITELQDDDEWNAYYRNLIIAVAKLRNSDSIPELLQVIDKDDAARQTLAGFGPTVLDAIYAKVDDPNLGIRLAGVTVIFEMLSPENEAKITDPAVRNRMEAVLKRAVRDKNINIQTTATEALNKLKTLKKRPESTYTY